MGIYQAMCANIAYAMHIYCILRGTSVECHTRSIPTLSWSEHGAAMNGNLRRLREAMALSRRELAKRSRVDESTIYRAEHGLTTLRPSTIQKLVRVLEVSPTEITRADVKADEDGRRRE